MLLYGFFFSVFEAIFEVEFVGLSFVGEEPKELFQLFLAFFNENSTIENYYYCRSCHSMIPS